MEKMQEVPQLNDYIYSIYDWKHIKYFLPSMKEALKLFSTIINNGHQVLAVFNFLCQQNFSNMVLC